MLIQAKIKTGLLLMLILILLSSCQSSYDKIVEHSKSNGDWPSYTFEELVSSSDFIVYGEITNTVNINSNPPSQESKMSILNVLKGDKTTKTITINLSDPSYYVKPTSNYIMFLNNTGSYYTQRTYNSLLLENNGVVSSSLQGLEGDFKIDEVQNKISDLLSKK